MALHQSDSIILKTYPLGEADRIVAFFSRDFGKMRGVANGARKMKNRFGASLEPLAHSRIEFFEMDRFLPEHEPQDAVFRLVRMTVRALEQGCPIDFAACYFEVWMLRLAGVFPDLFACSVCSRHMDLDATRFLAPGLQAVICSACDHGAATGILGDVVHLVYRILKNPLDINGGAADRAVNNLHELNQYWIRHYSER